MIIPIQQASRVKVYPTHLSSPIEGGSKEREGLQHIAYVPKNGSYETIIMFISLTLI